jgi:hypothetical protein
MAGMIAHAGQLARQLRYARERLQLVVKAAGRRAPDQRLGDLLFLRGAQAGFASGRALAAQGRGSAGLPLQMPIVSGLAPHAQTAGDLGVAPSRRDRGSYSSRLKFVTSQAICQSILRGSIRLRKRMIKKYLEKNGSRPFYMLVASSI